MTMHVFGVLLLCSMAWWTSSHGFYHHHPYWPLNTIKTREEWKPTCNDEIMPNAQKIECLNCSYLHKDPCMFNTTTGKWYKFCEHGTFYDEMCGVNGGLDCCKLRGQYCRMDEQCKYYLECRRNECQDPTVSKGRPGPIPEHYSKGPMVATKNRSPEDNFNEYSFDKSPNIEQLFEEYYD